MSELPPNGDPEVEAFIGQHFEHFNTNDAAIISPDFADNAYIVDAFAPFIWTSPGKIDRFRTKCGWLSVRSGLNARISRLPNYRIRINRIKSDGE